jgi:NAD(P)H-hydrate epimerase
MPGAAVLCCMAAYRIGAGLVEACVTEDVARAVQYHVPEAITRILPETGGGYGLDSYRALSAKAGAASVVILGPGIGRGKAVSDFVFAVTENGGRSPLLIDADGLNALAEDLSVLKKATAAITPHPGEMSRLLRVPVKEITADPTAAAVAFAKEYGVTVLLKGARTVVAPPDGGDVYVNTTGNAALAKAGSGDALAGMIAGLAAQGTNLTEACALAAYLHGKAGELAAETLSLYGVNASDVINTLPKVLMRYNKVAIPEAIS